MVQLVGAWLPGRRLQPATTKRPNEQPARRRFMVDIVYSWRGSRRTLRRFCWGRQPWSREREAPSGRLSSLESRESGVLAFRAWTLTDGRFHQGRESRPSVVLP